MIKIFVKALFILIFLNFKTYAEVISDFEILGNKRISQQTILVLGDLTKGKDYNSSQLNESLRKLYSTNFFSDVEISFENGILKIQVVENPIIEDIEITGIKNKNFLESIQNAIVLKNRMSFTENQLNKDIDLIKNILKVSGYYFAKINTSINKNDELN